MSPDPDPILQDYPGFTAKELRLRLMPRIERRTKLFYGIYATSFLEWSGIFLNPEILFEAVASSYLDIYRLKFFRGVHWVDEHKKAAYTMKWIARMRPVQIHGGAQLTKSVLMANAWFAVIAGLTLLGVNSSWKDDPWWANYTGNLAYLLHYHAPSVEQLSSEMCVLKTLDDSGG